MKNILFNIKNWLSNGYEDLTLKHFSGKKYFFLFLGLLLLWFFINILQAIFTPINSDEAYYALYGKNLAFGYFDHPPAVALINYLSSLFFSNNLSIRFITVVLQPITLFLTWLIITNKKSLNSIFVFFITSFSLVMFSAYGFITTPDVPLLFFTSLFLLFYKKFLENSNLKISLLLAISMSGLIYSKYQGGILIVLVILSNVKLLLNKYFWLAGILAIVLTIPHFYWQYIHDFPSFRFHLISRAEPFRWEFFLQYFPNQLAIFNPLIFGLVVYILVKKKNFLTFERALLFIVVGFIFGFALTTFRGHAEPHWTVIASIPMIILITNTAFENAKILNFVKKYIFLTLFLLIFIRICLLSNFLPPNLGLFEDEKKIKAIHEIAGDDPVVFIGSYYNPSMYWYLTKNEATVISSLYSRRTQFDIWKKDENLKNKEVFVVIDVADKSTNYDIDGYNIKGFFTDNLQVTNHLEVKFDATKIDFLNEERIELPILIKNNSLHSFDMNHKEFPVELCVSYINNHEILTEKVSLNEPIQVIEPNEEIERIITISNPNITNKSIVFCMSFTSIFGPTINSIPIKINF